MPHCLKLHVMTHSYSVYISRVWIRAVLYQCSSRRRQSSRAYDSSNLNLPAYLKLNSFKWHFLSSLRWERSEILDKMSRRDWYMCYFWGTSWPPDMRQLKIHVNQSFKRVFWDTMYLVALGIKCNVIVRGDRDSRANLMPIYGDLYQIKL